MKMQTTTLKKIIKSLSKTRPEEIGCDTCYEKIDQFVDMLNDGKDAEHVMPLVQHHLDMCGGCHEEFEALIKALEGSMKE